MADFAYDAVMVVSFGGPDGPDAIAPYLARVAHGRPIPAERLAEVAGHYEAVGGVSPINRRNEELVAALGAELGRLGVSVPIVVGNRNWHPLLEDTLAGLRASGARRVLALLTSAYGSYSGCRQYREGIAAMAGDGVEVTTPYALSDGFVAANADALAEALEGWPAEGTRVLFVTHSLPLSMAASSGPGAADLRYVAVHAQVQQRILADVAARGIAVPEAELVYCSRSGPPRVPWLTPDVNDRLRELPSEGVERVVLAPIGFIYDHLEVAYDLDVEASGTAASLGLASRRAATAGTHPAFIASLADLLLTRPDAGSGDREWCGPGCCRAEVRERPAH